MHEFFVYFDAGFFLRILYLKYFITVKGFDVLRHPPHVLTQILSLMYVNQHINSRFVCMVLQHGNGPYSKANMYSSSMSVNTAVANR